MSLSSRALCSLADLKGELSITSNSEDTRLERLIEAATSAIESYCARTEGFHYEAAREDMVRGYGSPIMHSPKTPIVSIGSIVWDPDDSNETVTSTLYAIDNARQGRIYREGGWAWTAADRTYLVSTVLPGTEQRLYQITYACGYVTQNQANLDNTLTRNLPHALEDACIQMAGMRYRWSPADPALASEKLGSWAASYNRSGDGGGLVPASVAGVLDSYKRLVTA